MIPSLILPGTPEREVEPVVPQHRADQDNLVHKAPGVSGIPVTASTERTTGELEVYM